ncbi:MAG: hypothetical protein FJ313_06740 [Gemmatimonadetes bacterium]|nr:hypothetical protein [Gemmatimonadota bacterium]
MKTLNRASAAVVAVSLIGLDSPGGWWVAVLLAGAAALAVLYVTSRRLGYFDPPLREVVPKRSCPRERPAGGCRPRGMPARGARRAA